MYRAHVARATYSACQSDVRNITLGIQWNVNLFAFLIHAHQKYVTSYIPRQHGPYTRLARPLLSAWVKGGWARDYTCTCTLLLKHQQFHLGESLVGPLKYDLGSTTKVDTTIYNILASNASLHGRRHGFTQNRSLGHSPLP